MRSTRFLSLLLCCVLCAGCLTGRPTPRVIVLGLDGVDPDVVDLMIAEGELPHFARLKKDGAYASL